MAERTGSKTPCAVCGRPMVAKGLCRKHYKRMRGGRPMVDPPTPSTCLFPGCEKPYWARGCCNGHLAQLYRGRELSQLGTPRPLKVADFVAAALANRTRTDECWIDWPFGWSNHTVPRPMVSIQGGKKVLVARYVYLLEHGEWPNWACHRCPLHPNGEDGRCWNPKHIYNGDASTNGADLRGSKTWRVSPR